MSQSWREADDAATRSTGMPSRGQSAAGSSQTSGGAMGQAQDVMTNIQQKASDLGDQATAKADSSMDKAAGGLDKVASTLREKSDMMSDGTMQTVATTAADKLHAGAELLRSKDTDELIDELEALIRRKPVESLLVAAGVGFLLSRGMR